MTGIKEFLESTDYWIGEPQEVKSWMDEGITMVLQEGWDSFIKQIEEDPDLCQRMSALCCDTKFKHLHLLQEPYRTFLKELLKRWGTTCIKRGWGFSTMEGLERAKANTLWIQ